MYIETTEIENQVEPVLYDDNDKPLLVLPTTEDEDGQRYMHVHDDIYNYMLRRKQGKPLFAGEYRRVNDLIRNYNRVGKWEPTKEDWVKSLEDLIQDRKHSENSKLNQLKKLLRKAIPDPERPPLPPRPTKVKRPLEDKEILPPTLPKQILNDLDKRSI